MNRISASRQDVATQPTLRAVGTIAGAAVILSKRALVDVTTVLMATVSLTALLGFKKIPEPILIVGATLSESCFIAVRKEVGRKSCGRYEYRSDTRPLDGRT